MRTSIKNILILVLLILATACFVVGCSVTTETQGTPSLKNIVFEGVEIDYDGEEHTILASNIPEGATVKYDNAGPYVDAGDYFITVTVSKEGYNSWSKSVRLKIKKLNFTGITFEDKTIDYDGHGYTITANGIPSFATATYTNQGPFTDAGEYDISLKVTNKNYNDYNATATLKIKKLNFTGITFEDKKVIANGKEKTIEISGNVPNGTSVTYTNNKGTAKGVYNASVTLTNKNYNTLTLNATLTIIDVLDTAKSTIDTLMERPDAWSFMPEAFSKQSLANTNSSVVDFTKNVNVSSINKKFMGKQMYVLWEGLNGMDTLLEKFDVVFAAGETIASAYQNFINDNSDNYAEWTANVAGFKVKILLDGEESTMLVGNNVFSLELYANSSDNINKGRIEIAEGGILNYEMTDDYLKFNVALNIKGVLAMKQIEFVRDEDDTVAGYFYEYAGLKSVAVKTSAVVAFNDDYAIVTSAKRESEDLLIEGYEEVYSSKTGEFISAEVLENNKLTDFDTFWVNVYDVTGINTIKAVDKGTVLPNENSHEVYVNGSNNILKATKNKIAFVETSRKFDIEMKTVYYVVGTANGNKTNYSVEETKIPMVFVQKKNVDDFSSDIVSDNKNTFNVTPTLPSSKIKVAEDNFETLYELLKTIKEKLTYDELENQLGTRNSFFN